MVLLFDKKIALIILLFTMVFGSFAQTDETVYNPKDYKNKDQFEKFRKKRLVVAAWQINQLKEGALIVRLRTNQTLINALKKQGNEELALQKEVEQLAINRNTLFAYKHQFSFCKVYFIYSNNSDELLSTKPSGIFLDSNLVIDPLITLNEKFYLIAERDYAYNSSIGFVKEDSAKYVSETGNPVKEMAVVIKNKYGHQLKAPFPYYVKDKTYAGKNSAVKETVVYNGVTKTALVGKQFSKEKQSLYIGILNDNLAQFFQSTSAPDLKKIDPTVLPFLY